jgi:hypothetical protein
MLAFAIIYFVCGSTFLAIRVGVREVPPLILAALRFFVAGVVLYGWMIARGERSPSLREWRSAALLGTVIFVLDYGLLFWAEQRVPSGVAAVMLATIPVFMALSEIIFFADADAHCPFGAGAFDRDWRSGSADILATGESRSAIKKFFFFARPPWVTSTTGGNLPSASRTGKALHVHFGGT